MKTIRTLLFACILLLATSLFAQESPPPPGNHGGGTNSATGGGGGGAPVDAGALVLPLMAAGYGLIKALKKRQR